MNSIKLNCLNFKKIFEVLKSFRVKDTLVLIEFNTSGAVSFKTIDNIGNFMRCVTISFDENFSIENNVEMSENIMAVIKNSDIIEILKNADYYSSCLLELKYDESNYTCEIIKFFMSNSNGDKFSPTINCTNIEPFKDLASINEFAFVVEANILFSFYMDRKLANMLKDCKDNVLYICLVKKELGYILTFGDEEYIVTPMFEAEINILEEAIISIDSRYLSKLNFQDSDKKGYHVDVTNDLLLLRNERNWEFIIIRSM